MRRLLALFGCLIAAPLAADDVYLKNGRVFEDVEAEVVGSKVVVHLSYGEIGFSRDAVERIEESVSSHALYRQRRDALTADPGVTAADWLALAEWARRRGLEHATREAAVAAARLDPDLPGLGAILAELDFVREAASGRWVERDEHLERLGYVRSDGGWLSPEQQLTRQRLEAEAARAREAEEDRRLTRALVALAAAQLAQESRPPEPQPTYAWPVAVFPNPFVWRHPAPHRLPPPGHDPIAIPIERRQPGSLFPIEHRGRVASPTGAPAGSRTVSSNRSR